ncbi:hypothetical protein [Ectopseudomonas toyotomiensis]|uniref:Uncharacterized protein n=1 Tax=Ectopseudomonas toyotomiensis TaxID=554344 RepID=A0AA42LGH5_9GAMM|nr:hypothetical protein [Pseudomonas toyotomiensis]MBG0838752.1 hypothetical protein [Pseudomonas toyotomiensis]MDH0700174.1 hypothetical protein [Pseudomonas toyotomiensis]
MLKELAIIANVAGSVYFMGSILLQHDKAKYLVESMESGFKGLLSEIKDKKPADTIQMLLKIFGGITGAAFLGILLMGILRIHSQQLAFALSITFLISGVLSGSLFWVLKHKEVLKQAGKWLLFFGGGSLLFPVMDLLTNAGITNVVYSMLQSSFSSLLALPNGNGLIYEASVVTGFYAGFVIIFYAIAWLYAAPTALAAWLIIATLIYSARVINSAFPKQPIAVVFFALWLFSVFYFSYASSP